MTDTQRREYHLTRLNGADVNQTGHTIQGYDFLWIEKETTLTNIAITPITDVLDVRPCDKITIHVDVSAGTIDAYLRASVENPVTRDRNEDQYIGRVQPSTWQNLHSKTQYQAGDNLFARPYMLDVRELGINFLRLDALKTSSDDAVIKTTYRGNIHGAKNENHVVEFQSDPNA